MSHDVTFETRPDDYAHWKLSFDGPVATLAMAVQEDRPIKEGYALKLNSYDLGVDIELADAIERLRFEHPEVKVVVVTSVLERVFCAGANIRMLGASTHAWKVNFCKFTNETRLYLEEASAHSGLKSLAALNGIAAGGGYELALACDEILLVADGSSVVSPPEVALLGVLPGPGGLTRVTDKRKGRRDLADVFCSNADGVKGERAVAWGLVDAVAPRSKWDGAIAERAAALAATSDRPGEGEGIALTPLAPEVSETSLHYRHVRVSIDPATRIAELFMQGPGGAPPASAAAPRALGVAGWVLRDCRGHDDALLRLHAGQARVRFDVHPVEVLARGDPARNGVGHRHRVTKRLDHVGTDRQEKINAVEVVLGDRVL